LYDLNCRKRNLAASWVLRGKEVVSGEPPRNKKGKNIFIGNKMATAGAKTSICQKSSVTVVYLVAQL